MGLDFIRKAAKSFHKGLDQSLVDLGTPNLFTLQPNCESRAYAATICANSIISAGEVLSVRFQDDKIIAQRGMSVVAEFVSPPAELVDAIKESYGEAWGTVTEIYEIANTAEIIVC
jgi:hypothetical protein